MPKLSGSKKVRNAKRRLAALFQRNGYVRRPDLARREEEGADVYKKGWEVRLSLKSEAELAEARRLIDTVGLNPGKPFKKANQVVLPIYGRHAVEAFTSWTPED